MKTIKLVSQKGEFLLKSAEGELISLPKNSSDINNYIFDKDLDNDTRYFIELSPDETNPLNFDGIIIGLKLYLENLRINNLKIEIILFGFDTKEFVFQNCDYSLFFKCPNVSYYKVDFNNELNLQNNLCQIIKEEAIDKLKMIGIKPPTSYKTNHSIANEWAIYRWSKYLGIKQTLSDEINNSLFFSYLRTIYEIEEVETREKLLDISGKILLIDDEEEKGWANFFKNLRLPAVDKVNFDSIGEEFKNIGNQYEIIKKVKDRINSFKPDLVILDLRLIDSDFEESNPKELTGYKILESIKTEINKGIQVILFTASNKIWNFQSLSEIGFDGWIVKESPEQSRDINYTINTISNIKNEIELGINKASILKGIQSSFINLKKQTEFYLNENFNSNLFGNLDISYDLIEKSFTNKKYMKYAFLQLFLIIEEFIKQEEIFEENDDCYIKSTKNDILVAKRNKNTIELAIKMTSNGKYELQNSKISVSEKRIYRFDTNFYVSALLIFKYGNTNSSVKNWTSIYKVRNRKAAHFSDNNITIDDINKLIDFIIYLLDIKNNENPINHDKSLPKKTFEESLENLKNDPRFKGKNKF